MEDFIVKVLEVSAFAAVTALIVSFWVAFGFLAGYTVLTLIPLFS